ncbi:30S ribosome-binding factor RbfA [Jannaschia seohaensis]|uniref:Ribosome-binding factor A n=1 Tax=Jannaschia seohaensis TaxID=475081 RepID=A0A2Y9A4A7_9RHOB|nr:30S ribosome-binding factor RbfA [Jannaschia seohaensis]PWJ22000.1 ribosome-binding factor A [Jannaschia seohaensis]SSA38278.1 ribosome-binding factor A [Jannaschia seohaensis]
MARSRSEDRGPSQRQLRVGELIRRTLSEVLMRGEVHDPELNAMSITVGEVTITRDLKIATAWIMPLGGERAEEAIAALNRNRGALRHLVMNGLTLRHAPELRFRIDETFDRMDATRRMLADPRVRRDVEAGGEAGGEADGEDTE